MKEKCYELLKKIPPGKITTYKELAKALNTKAYRAIGTLLKQNKNPDIPCYKVVKSNQLIGEYNKGVQLKKKLLEKEGIKIKNNKILNFKNKLHKF